MSNYDDWMESWYEEFKPGGDVFYWSDVSSTMHWNADHPDGMGGWADTYSWILHLPEKEEE